VSADLDPLAKAPDGAGGPPARELGFRITPIPTLTREAIQEMHRLFRAHFQARDTDAFFRDFNRKQFVIQILDGEDRLQGFSTITSYRTSYRGRTVGVVYSGDTIITPECWGTSALPRAWLQVVMEMAPNLPRPLYWLLLSSGYKTYRFLPVFFRRFFPGFDDETPEEVRGLINRLAQELAGGQFNAEKGIIRFQHGATPLRPGVAELDERRLKDPHTAFFLECNPGHMEGDELVCLAEISDENLTRGGRRILRALGKERLG